MVSPLSGLFYFRVGFFFPQAVQILLLGWLPLGICKSQFGHCLRRGWSRSRVLWGGGMFFSVLLLFSFLCPCLTLRFGPKPGLHQGEVT